MHPVSLLASSAAASGHAHLPGTLLPQGFFLAVGLFFLACLAVDRGAARIRLPVGVAVLLLGLGSQELVLNVLHVSAAHAETADRVSLALLVFYAGLGTDLRRIRGMVGAGLRLGGLALLIQVGLMALLLMALLPLLPDAKQLGLGGATLTSAAWLTATCLTAQDSGSVEDQLQALDHRLDARLAHLEQFATALSMVGSLLLFGFLVGLLQLDSHSNHLELHTTLVGDLNGQLFNVVRHVLAGALAGALVGGLAPRLVDGLVRSEQHLLLMAIALAFVAFGLGQLLGGGGYIAVFSAGVWLSNGHYRLQRFNQNAMHHVMHPFNTAAEYTLLLLLGLTVQPALVITVLPLGLVVAAVLPLIRWVGVSLACPGRPFSARDRALLVSCGLPGAVSLGLALALEGEWRHLSRGSTAAIHELGALLLALIFVVVLANMLLQRWLALRWAPTVADQPAEH